MKKLIALFIPLLILAAVISTAVFSANAYAEVTIENLGLTIGGIDITENVDYKVGSDDGSEANIVLFILSDKEMTISGTLISEARIKVTSENGANLIFSDLKIKINQGKLSDPYNNSNPSAAFAVADSVKGVVAITLKGDNLLQSGTGHAGLENNSVPLVIEGDGTLEACGFGGGAGIGGARGRDGENITIKSGTIIAKGIGGAGIGGGENGSGKNIRIESGTVTADGTGSKSEIIPDPENPKYNKVLTDEYYNGGGAGIGGGKNGSGSGITITGGTVEASGMRGAGIGGGLYGNGEYITIKDGTVTAKVVSDNTSKSTFDGSAGIGGGCGGNAKEITINGGTVIAKNCVNNFDNAAGDGAGIGGGAYCAKDENGNDRDGTGGLCKDVTICGNANVTAYGGANGAGIGGGKGGSCDNITIEQKDTGEIEAHGSGGAGIGGGNGGNGEKIYISGSGTIKAESTSSGAGIGGGTSGKGETIDISGSVKVTAKSSSGAGIGGGNGADGSHITIAIDDPDPEVNPENININDPSSLGTLNAYVVATSSSGAGIGGGSSTSTYDYNNGQYIVKDSNGTDITIESGYIGAVSSSGAGIGGGSGIVVNVGSYPNSTQVAYGGSGTDITISGGYINAEGSMGAGIGGGQYGSGSSITIDDCLGIQATSNGGAGIGGGVCGNCDNIKITGGNDINATGNAGIGGGMNQPYAGGNNGNATNITITGDAEVIATGQGGAGIGSGMSYDGNGSIASGITISGNANVTATGYNGAGIGSGRNGSAEGIEISGNANVTAEGYGGAGIGSGQGGSAEGIEISGNANVDATGYGCSGVGSGSGGSCEDITISSGTVRAEGKGAGDDVVPGISGTTVIMGEDETSYPWIKTNGIDGLTESERSDLAIVFDLDGKVGTVYGGTVQLTENRTIESPCEKLIVPTGATFVTYDDVTNENFLTLNDVILYLEADAKLNKYKNMTLNGNSEIQHEDPSEYVYDEDLSKSVCDICGKEEPHKWGTEWVYDDDDSTHHWHECTPDKDCSLSQNQLQACSITENSRKDGYGEHEYDFDDPHYEDDGKLHYFCIDCNYELIVEIPTIQLTKVDDNGDPLEGAEFGLYSNEACTTLNESTNQNASNTATTAKDENGNAVVSFAAELYKIYYIKEIKAPNGYTASDKVFKAIVDKSGNVTYGDDNSEDIPICKNTKINPDPAKIIKVDGETNVPLEGAEFSLYSDAECTELINTATTAKDAEGKAVVSFATELGKTYYIKETKAPDGYTASDKVFKAVVDADGKVTYGDVDSETTSENIPVCENYPVEVISDPAKLIKVDGETGEPLAGAQFGIYDDKECVGEPIKTATTKIDTDENSATSGKAVVSFDTELDNTYYIKEIAAPEGYNASDEVFKVVVGADGKVTYGDINSEITSENIPVCENYPVEVISDPAKIIKVDGETGEPLAGAQFGIYRNAQCANTDLITTKTTVIDADNKAVVSFTTDPGKTYYIKETKAPDGYKISDKVFKVVVDADGKVTYGDVDSEATSAEIPECKNYAVEIIPDPIEIIPNPVKIILVDGETRKPLTGGEFGIFDDENCTITNTTAITEIDTDTESDTYNKAVVSFVTELNKTYYIKETKAPDGYTASDKVFKAVVGEDGKVTYSVVGFETTSTDIPICENYAIKVIVFDPAKIIKVDGETGDPLVGAEFGIFSDDKCTELINTDITAKDADNKAVVSFDTEPNKTYYIKETKAPDGYKISGDVFKAVVDADGKVTYGDVDSEATSAEIPECKNYAVEIIPDPVEVVPAPAKIIKVDGATGKPLAGAQFGIYSDEKCTKLITTKATAIDADNKAVVSFDTELNATYYIKEIAAPNGYTISDKVFKAIVGTDGKVTYGAADSESTSAEIPECKNYAVEIIPDPVEIIPDPAKIIKVDSATGEPLAGAQFGIYSDEECTKLITTKTTAINANNKAVVSFDTVLNTTYYIKEIAAPNGYTISDKVFKAIVGADGKVTYGVVGSDIASEDIPVCENEKSANADTSVPTDTPPNDTDNPETGVGLGIAGFAVLSGTICATSLVKGAQSRRKRKNNDKKKIDS